MKSIGNNKTHIDEKISAWDLWNLGKRAFAERKLAKARVFFRACSKKAKSQGDKQLAFQSNHELLGLFLGNCEFKKAQSICFEQLELILDLYGEDSLQKGWILCDLAFIQKALDENTAQKITLRELNKLITIALKSNLAVGFVFLDRLVLFFQQNKESKQARKAYTMAVKLCRKFPGLDKGFLIQALNRLAIFEQKQGNLRCAHFATLQAITLAQRHLPDHPILASLKNRIALLPKIH